MTHADLALKGRNLETRYIGPVDRIGRTVDVRGLVSPARFDRERTAIFRRAWLPICHTWDIPKRGDYLIKDYPGIGAHLLITRGQDDEIRVFHNVCRHRANKLVCEHKGNRSNFSCNFHGWVYSNTGALRAVMNEDEFRDLDKEKLGLAPVHSAVWETLIFINLAGEPPMSLREWLGEIGDQYTGFFDAFGPGDPFRANVKCNWNLVPNAFAEAYHTRFLHRKTAGNSLSGDDDNPDRHLHALELLERHSRFSVPKNAAAEPRPIETALFPQSRWGALTRPADAPPGINFAGVDAWGMDIVHIFPNYIFVPNYTYFFEGMYWPLSYNETYVEHGIYLKPPRTTAEEIGMRFRRSFGRELVSEDFSTLENQSAMLESGAISEIILSDQELALAQHYKVSRAMIEDVFGKEPGGDR